MQASTTATPTPVPTATPRPTYTPKLTPTSRVIVVTPIPTPTLSAWDNQVIATSHNHKGEAYYDDGKYQQAIQDFDKALRLDTGNAIAYANRGIAYGRMGLDAKADADKAMACWLDQQYC